MFLYEETKEQGVRMMAKKIIAAVLALAMLFAFAGCNMAQVNETRDNAQVIIEIGDKKVLKGDVKDTYDSYMNMYAQMYGTDAESFKKNYADAYQSLIDGIVDSFVEEALVDIYAEKLDADLSLTDEQVKKVDESMQSNYDYYKEQVTKTVNEDETIADDKKEAEIERQLNAMLDQNGYNDGSMRANLEDSYKIENMKTWLDKDYKATEDDLKAFYDKQVEEQKKVLDETPSSISKYEGDGEVSLYVPKGLRYVQALYIPMSDEYISQISSSRSNNDTDTADALKKTALGLIDSTAQEALTEAKKDFDAAIDKYGDDATKNAKETGVRTYKGDSSYPTEVTDYLFDMATKGQISDLIATDKGYYIIKFVDEMTAGTTPLSKVHDDLMDKMVEDHKNDTYTTKLAEWKDETVIKTYTDRL